MIIRGLELINDNAKDIVARLIADLNLHQTDIFKPTFIVVPNTSYGNWLRDLITKRLGLVSNIRFMVLNQFINMIYQDLNPEVKLASISSIRYSIYDYLCSCDLNDSVLSPIKSNIVDEDSGIVLSKVFELAIQLEQIIGDYLYLRTDQIIYDEHFWAKLPKWQQLIISNVIKLDVTSGKLSQSKQQVTFLDVYKFFSVVQEIKLDYSIFIFGISSVFPSQLMILKKIIESNNYKWYITVPTLEYYNDLLDDKTREKLKRKILKEPEISVNDLYLTDGNPLLANLGIQSREFNELIIANDFDSNDFELNESFLPSTLLSIIQSDIRRINNRIAKDKRTNDNGEYYVDPVIFSDEYDNSIRINICHNQMREVQVMFNFICEILSNDKDIKLHDIVVVAPNIDEYKVYINAVLSNEYIYGNDNSLKVPYTICGLKDSVDTQLLDCILCILKLDYKLKVNSVFELLNQTKLMQILDINVQDVNLIRVWLDDNNIHFGIDAKDYSQFGYEELDLFTFRRLLNNLVLGSTIPNGVFVGECKPLFNYFAYDNLEFTQIELCNKLIKFITFLEQFRQCFYVDEYNYKSMSVSTVVTFLTKFSTDFLTDNSDIQSMSQLVTLFNIVKLTHHIDLPIVITMLNNFYNKNNEMLYTSGKVTFTSMKSIKNIPYKVIYILGMNYGEFPRLNNKNRLSILHISGVFADINANVEDKQLFLDIILSAQKYLYFSYIGRSDSDNSVLYPSVILNLLITVLKNSIADTDYVEKHVIKVHPLHPYLNKEPQYSKFWAEIINSDITKNLHWDWSCNGEIKNTSLAINQGYGLSVDEDRLEIKLDKLINTFYYSNANLYSELQINTYNIADTLSDDETITLTSKTDTNKLISELELLNKLNYTNYDTKNVFYSHLYNKGLLAYGELGWHQFNNLYSRFIEYKQLRQKNEVKLEYYNEKYDIRINGDLLLNENNEVIILQEFKYFIKNKDKVTKANEISYHLKIKALICLLLLADENSKFISNCDTIVDNIVRDVVYIKINANSSYMVKLEGGVDKKALFEDVILIYKNSLVRPILIDRSAIEYFSKDYKKIISETINMDQIILSKLSDEVKNDRIFYNNLDGYLSYNLPLTNSILQIALLLSKLNIE